MLEVFVFICTGKMNFAYSNAFPCTTGTTSLTPSNPVLKTEGNVFQENHRQLRRTQNLTSIPDSLWS